ncbi:MAG: BCCT family transporter [Deltaproteobacteria bacterium]|jgi:choline-glycine betaine transporter|nr:BCCT family transporter [Deltaproteobacteria bacterium]
MTNNNQTALTKGAKHIRWYIFLPPWLLVVLLLVLNLINFDVFMKVVNGANGWILANFSWLFNSTAFICVVVVLITFCSPFGRVRIGGSKAKPLMNYSNLTWIVLCTIMAAGILLWAAAEPMYHIYGPPKNVTEGPNSPAAIAWAIETILLEWTFTPMAIYSVPAILFAFVFYNMRKEYSIGSMFYPVLGERVTKTIMPVVDCVCLYALVAGMAASLGSGILLLAGGAESVFGIKSQSSSWAVAALLIVIAFVISAISGLMKGIRILSLLNSRFYLLMVLYIFLFGPTAYLMNFMVESVGLYLNDFFKISLWTSTAAGDHWSEWWPTFYWCNWMAWMPVTAVFLGRLTRGYTVRESLVAIFFVPAIFSIVWLALFSGTSINFDLNGLGINEARVNSGAEGSTYAIFRKLPFSMVTIPFFLLIVFISFVTAADSNTNAMSGLCSSGLSVTDQESPTSLKIVWGMTIGGLSLIMLNASGIDGLKMASNLGGFPNVFFLVLMCAALLKIVKNPSRYDLFKEDYDQYGRPIPSERSAPEFQDTQPLKHRLRKILLGT